MLGSLQYKNQSILSRREAFMVLQVSTRKVNLVCRIALGRRYIGKNLRDVPGRFIDEINSDFTSFILLGQVPP